MMLMISCGLLCIVAALAISESKSTRIEPSFWNKGKLYYDFNTNLEKTPREIQLLEQSMKEIEQAVNIDQLKCIQFVKTKNQERLYVVPGSKDGLCLTETVAAKTSSKFRVNLREDCTDNRTIISSLLVLMGLYHEHQRPDRDQYIQVHTNNVQDGTQGSFDKVSGVPTDLSDMPYDFHSITHYGEYQYAINQSLPTITANVSGVSFGGESLLSFYDVIKVQTLYGCSKGYPMLINSTSYFRQKSKEAFYPQWHNSSESDPPHYMTTKCNRTGSHGVYTLTVLHGATWTSKLPLPAGNFSISVDICISSSSPDIKSYIQLMEGPDSHRLNYTSSSGEWETLTVPHTSEDEWNVVMKAHILWGEDVLALDNLIVSCIGHC